MLALLINTPHFLLHTEAPRTYFLHTSNEDACDGEDESKAFQSKTGNVAFRAKCTSISRAL